MLMINFEIGMQFLVKKSLEDWRFKKKYGYLVNATVANVIWEYKKIYIFRVDD